MTAADQCSSAAVNPSEVRTDIQALRGLAVMLVIGFHGWPTIIRSGYLGVDIFFVISGYLITKMVKTAVLGGHFSFADFYSRRIRRLLPAAYTTFAVTAILAIILLSEKELRDFFWQLTGAVTFSANVALWRQTGYFAGTADLKPLLHVWSLSIEEQYYLLWPAFLAFTPRRYWLGGAVLLFGVSISLWHLRAPLHPGATFYLLPTRAWEITIGAIGALIAVAGHWARLLGFLYWPAVLAVIVLPCLLIDNDLQPVATVVACLATIIVILRQHPAVHYAWPVRWAAVIGNFSYSLYLVHWPILALFRNVWFGDVPAYLKLAYLLLALGLGFLQYRYIEMPLRRSAFRLSWRSAGLLVAASVALIAGPYFAVRSAPALTGVTSSYGLDPECEYTGDFSPKPGCITRARSSILIWGDSFATHLVPGFVLTASDAGVRQATRSACGPLLSIAPVNRSAGTQYNRAWAESCIQFNDSVLAYLERTKEIELVVLSSPFRGYVDRERDRVLENHVLIEAGPTAALAGLKRTVEKIRSFGRRVVIIGPPPSTGDDVARCQERKARGQFTLGPLANCEIPFDTYAQHRRQVREFVQRVPEAVGVEVISLEKFLCQNGTCATMVDGKLLYRDGSHLSAEGSRLIAQRMGWLELIRAKAR